jgi:hypothetical protein
MAAQNIATILETLRNEVRAQRREVEAASGGGALSPQARELRHCAEQIEITRVVSAHWPLEGGTLYERGWAFINKVVRRYLRWYINPIVEQQNAYNDVSARAIRLLIEENATLRAEIAALRGDVEKQNS